jgi:hypothetical protein
MCTYRSAVLPNKCGSKDLAVFNKKHNGLRKEMGNCHIANRLQRKRKVEEDRSADPLD